MSKLTKLINSPAKFFADAPLVRRTPTLAAVLSLLEHKRQSRSKQTRSVSPPAKAEAQPTQVFRVLLADDFHLNTRNFPSLFAALDRKGFVTTVGIASKSAHGQLIRACGDYAVHERGLLDIYRMAVAEKSLEELLELRYHNVDILSAALDEAISACAASPEWQDGFAEKSRHTMARRLWENNRRVLLNCCAAAMYWADYWRKQPLLNEYHAAVIFSGSYIYGRVLLELLAYTKARAFVVESFTTGFDFYLEERHRPIPNASLISYPNVYRSYTAEAESDRDRWYRDKIRAFNKLRIMKNKNVQQPDPEPLPIEMRNRRVALILGQVVNDFSLISGDGSVLATLPVYKDMIRSLLQDPETFVVFKAHPWERKKDNVGRAFTAEMLADWVASLTPEDRGRVMITENRNLRQLLSVANGVFTICSQAGIEAAAEGFKVFTIGGAFYDVGGFTNAFRTPREAVEKFLSGDAQPLMDLEEFADFEAFLTILLQRHLFNTDHSGTAKILETLKAYAPQSHASITQSELAVQPNWSRAWPEGHVA